MFTIIIPIYNTERYIKDCLESVKNQTYDNFEVLMINDGSIDKSLEIITEYSANDSRFKVISTNNQGLSKARNIGIKMANNPYIIFVDSDDRINKDLLNRLNEEIIMNNPDLIRYGVDIIGESDSRRFRFNIKSSNMIIDGNNAIKDWSLSNVTYALPWIYAIRKSIFLDNNLFFTDGRIHEDYLLMPFLIANSKKISVIDYIGYNYYLRDGSISLPKNLSNLKRNLFHFILCYKDIINNIDKMNLTPEVELIFLEDQRRRLMKEMSKANYNIRIQIIEELDEKLFTSDEENLIRNRKFNKKTLRKVNKII